LTNSTVAPSRTYSKFFGPAKFLDVKDLLMLGSASSILCKLAQEDGFWRIFCLRHFSIQKLQHCTNYRAALMSNDARWRQKNMQRRHTEELYKWETQKRKLKTDLQGQINNSVRWTIPRRLLYRAPKGTAISSPAFVVHGIRGRFEFYSKGDRDPFNCSAFYIYPFQNQDIDMVANVFIGDQNCQTISKSWGKNAQRKEGYGIQDVGWWYGNPAKDLVIQVDFKTFERLHAISFCIIRSWHVSRCP